MVRLVAAFLLAAEIASAQVYVRTNDVLNLDPLSEVMQAQIGQQFRLRYVVTQGGVVQDITGYRITFEMIDVRDSIVSQTGTVQILDAPAGDVSVRFNVSGPTLQIGQTYQGVSKAYIGSNYVGLLSDDYISIVEAYCPTCSVSGGGGGGSTSITVTNLNTSSVIVTNLIVSTNIISVTVTNTGGGGGGSGTLSGFNSATTGGVFLVVSNGWDASITNEGNVFTINTGLPKGATGVNQVATWNGTNWIATALGAPTPTPTVGTNVIKWATVWGITNTWVAPSTQIMFTAWGGTGGGGSGGGGHSRAIWVGSAGTIFDIVVASATAAASSNNGPFAGSGINAGVTNYPNGGGATYIAISGTTNIILIAGGSGGGGIGSGVGGPGGGFWFGYGDGTLVGSNALAGQGAWASNEYGLAATAGTNSAITTTNTMQNGGYLRGGHASTNGATASINAPMGGGGGGWYGGSGAARTNATSGSLIGGAGGGGGLGYADTNYVIFAQIIGGTRGVSGSPAGQDHPTYTSGRGVGAGSGTTAGSAGCAGAMW